MGTLSAITHDSDVVEVLQNLINWHSNKSEQLHLIQNNMNADIVFGDTRIPANSDLAKGIRIGVAISLEALGNLPIRLAKQETNEPDAFVEGREVGLAGATDADNPYPIGSDEAMDWEDGRASTEE